ncbi:MAG: hypothetical protein F7C38_06670 [Desulfurococcales archaeon]|nr:hypothetical protein [Desulfurococcales archaeon]
MVPKLSDYLGDDRGRLRSERETCSEKQIKKIVEITIAEFMEPLMKELKELRKEVSNLRDAVERLDKRVKSSSGEGPSRPGRRSPGIERVKRLIEKEGFLLASQSMQKTGVSGYRLASLKGASGFVVLDTGTDFIVFTEDTYNEFINLLSRINTPDPDEAANMLGRFKEAFYTMRNSSMIYYDTKRKGWRLLF